MRATLPLFPLGNVLFPAGRLALRIFEPRYRRLTAECLRDGSVFGVCLIRGGFEVGAPAIPHAIGCTARILEWQQPAPDRYTLIAQGESLFRVQDRQTEADGLLRATVEMLDPADPVSLPARHARLAALLRRAVTALGAEAFPAPLRLDDASWVANRLAELLPVPPERRQQWLEMADPLARLESIAASLDALDTDD